MKKWDRNCTDYLKVNEDDLDSYWDAGLVYKNHAKNYLDCPETMNLPFSKSIKPLRLVYPTVAGTFVENFLRKRTTMNKTGRHTDGVKDGLVYEIKASTIGLKAIFRQVKFNVGADVFWCLVMFNDKAYNLYALTADQMYKEAEDQGLVKTHTATTGVHEEHAEYNVRYKTEWNQLYQIDSSFMETDKTPVEMYPEQGFVFPELVAEKV